MSQIYLDIAGYRVMTDGQAVGHGEMLGLGAMISPRISKVSKMRGTSLLRKASHSMILREYPNSHAPDFWLRC